MRMTDPQLQMGRAITSIICDCEPFYSTVLLSLERIADPSVPTACTNGLWIRYNPDFVAGLSHDETVGLLLHEVLHVADLHTIRREWRDPFFWNVAADHVINDILTKASYHLPKGALPGIPDTTPEAVYPTIEKENPSYRELVGTVCDPTDEQGRPLPADQRYTYEQDIRGVVSRAIAASQTAGRIPAGLERLFELGKPKIPWQTLLASYVTRSRTDYSWRRPNPRYQVVSPDIFLPMLRNEQLNDVVLACDTSGSMYDDLMSKVVTEVMSLRALCGAMDLLVLWSDTRVTAQTISCAEDLKPVGGGGTMFSPVFSYVEREIPEAQVVVYLTDGYSEGFGPPPQADVLWLIVGDNKNFTPPFGEVGYVESSV